MARIRSDNKEVRKALETLAALVTKEGGVLSDHLTIECQGGNIGLTSDLPRESRDELISIPRSCFLPLSKVEFCLEKDKLAVVSGADSLSKSQQAMLGVMIDLYNLTDKIAKYKAMSPRIVFRGDQELVKQLVAGRAGTSLAQRFFDVIESVNIDNLVIDYFFRTRNFNLEDETRQIIPFIDFTNHHTLARPFRRDRESGKIAKMALENDKAVPGSDECFARYGLWDPYDTYLMFGFAFRPGGFVRSVPLELDIQGLGNLRIRSVVAGPASADTLGPVNKDLARFFPKKINKTKQGLSLSNLNIPNASSPRALKRTLDIVVDTIVPGLRPAQRQQMTALIEERVLQANVAYYKGLTEYLGQRAPEYPDCPAFDEARKMARIQLQTLSAYRSAQTPKG